MSSVVRTERASELLFETTLSAQFGVSAPDRLPDSSLRRRRLLLLLCGRGQDRPGRARARHRCSAARSLVGRERSAAAPSPRRVVRTPKSNVRYIAKPKRGEESARSGRESLESGGHTRPTRTMRKAHARQKRRRRRRAASGAALPSAVLPSRPPPSPPDSTDHENTTPYATGRGER